MKIISKTLQAIGALPAGKNLLNGMWDVPNESLNVMLTWKDRNRVIDGQLHVRLWDERKDGAFENAGRRGARARARCIEELVSGKPTVAVQVQDANIDANTYNTAEHKRKIAPSANRVVFLLDNTIIRPDDDGDPHLVYCPVVHRFKDDAEAREFITDKLSAGGAA